MSVIITCNAKRAPSYQETATQPQHLRIFSTPSWRRETCLSLPNWENCNWAIAQFSECHAKSTARHLEQTSHIPLALHVGGPVCCIPTSLCQCQWSNSLCFRARSKNCEKIRQLTSSCLSVCPLVGMKLLGSHWSDFHEIWCSRVFEILLRGYKFH
jgi:hypothetical protein